MANKIIDNLKIINKNDSVLNPVIDKKEAYPVELLGSFKKDGHEQKQRAFKKESVCARCKKTGKFFRYCLSCKDYLEGPKNVRPSFN